MRRRARTCSLALLLSTLAGPAVTGPNGFADPPAAAAGRVRPPALAGTWYPGSPALLAATARHLLREAAAAPSLDARPFALVVPHAGWAYSGPAAAAAFRLLSPGEFTRVVVVAPSHYGGFGGYALDDAAAYRTPLGEIPLDRAAVARLAGGSLTRALPRVTEPEHAIEIELPFLQSALGSFQLVPVLVGQTSAAEEAAFAERLAALADGRTLFVFSSDFTHYGPRFDYQPYGKAAGAAERIRQLDGKAIELLGRGDPDAFRSFLAETGATICGRHGLSTLLELLRRASPFSRASLLSHYASLDLPGVRDDSSVDYAALAFARGDAAGRPLGPPAAVLSVPLDAPPLDGALGARLVRVARAALEAELAGGASRLVSELRDLGDGPELSRLQAVFVTLKRKDPSEAARLGELRGCIGQVEPTYPLDVAVVRSALDAALDDPRFPAVEARELPRLSVEVTVLSPIRPVASWKEIRVGTHGIVLTKGANRALFLPQVATEQGWTLGETLDHLSVKAGLAPGAWRTGAQLSVFSGQLFHEARESR